MHCARLRLGQIYFAAPDIDTRLFVNDLGAYIDIADRVSVAANLNDSVLRFAAVVGRVSRAGPEPDRTQHRAVEVSGRCIAEVTR